MNKQLSKIFNKYKTYEMFLLDIMSKIYLKVVIPLFRSS